MQIVGFLMPKLNYNCDKHDENRSFDMDVKKDVMYICKHIFSIILSHGSVETRAVTPASVEMRPQNNTVYVNK